MIYHEPFMFTSEVRSGSNLLRSYFWSHPNVHLHGRLFIGNKSNFKRITKEVYDKSIKAVGIRFEYSNLKKLKNHPEVEKEIRDRKDIKIIHLIRKNVFKQFVSLRLAEYNDSFQEKIYDKLDINISKKACTNFFSRRKRDREKVQKYFSENESITVYYEDLLNSEELWRIQDFLKVPRVKFTTSLVKQRNKKIQDFLSNYNELKEAFKGTEYEDFFE